MNSLLHKKNINEMAHLDEASPFPFPGVIGTFMGRDALSLAVTSLDLGLNDKVLLPAYLCQEVLKPFFGKTWVEFYELQPDLTIDPGEIQLKLARDKVKIVLIINYFGFVQPYRKEIREICADRGVILIEDCAHSLLTEGSGEIGDISIYSFAKILPLPDGGGLKMNTEGKAVRPNFHPRIYSNMLSVLITLKSFFKVRSYIISRAWFTSRTKNLGPKATLADKNSRFLPLSSFAYNGMKKISFNEVIDRRRRDYQHWQSVAEKTNLFIPIFSDLPSGVCPFAFPVKVKNRDLLKSRLQKEGIFLKIHWHLPKMVGRSFVNSHKLSAQTITFPVYPELGRREREKIERLLDL